MAWRRIYLLLALVRLYFALSPSYIHPDEHFQGPEVVAGLSAPLPPLFPPASPCTSHNLLKQVTGTRCRRCLQLDHHKNLGIHLVKPDPQQRPVMAHLRPADGIPEVGWWGRAARSNARL